MEAATRQHHPQVVVEGAVEAAVIPTGRLAELHKGMRVGGVWAVPLGLAVVGALREQETTPVRCREQEASV